MFDLANNFAATLLDTSVKSIIVLLVILLTLSTLWLANQRRHNVHLAHRVWLFALLAILFLPVLHWTIPSWKLPFLTMDQTASTADVSTDSESELANGSGSRLSPVNVSEDHHETPAGFNSAALPRSPGSPNIPLDRLNQDETGSDNPTVLSTFAGVTQVAKTSEKTTRSTTGWLVVLATVVWMIGALIMLVRFLVAAVITRRMIAGASKISLSAVANLPPRTQILQSDVILSPVVSGLISNSIIVPACWQNWSPQKIDAVLAHESAHIYRRDSLTSLLAELAVIVHWFNPISWVVRRQLSHWAELASDEMAALAIGDRIDYARQLLEIAELNQAGLQFQPGIAMAATSEISKCQVPPG